MNLQLFIQIPIFLSKTAKLSLVPAFQMSGIDAFLFHTRKLNVFGLLLGQQKVLP